MSTGKRQIPGGKRGKARAGRRGSRAMKRTRPVKRTIALTALGAAVVMGVLCWRIPALRMWEKEREGEDISLSASESAAISSDSVSPEETEFLVEEIPEETISPDASVSLFFSGDILLDSHVTPNYDAQGITGILSQELVDEMTGADICMVNEEFPFTTSDSKYPGKQYNFKADPSYVSAFLDMGVDIATLANNHILDYYYQGGIDSIETLTEAGIKYSGVGTTLEEAGKLDTFEVDGITVGFLSASRVFPDMGWNIAYNGVQVDCGCLSAYDPTDLLNFIAEADDQCDFLVVYIHWGKEKVATPLDYQRELGQQMIDNGADLIIGSHSHVPQGVEYYNGVPIFYSMGNYIFNSANQNVIALKVTVDAQLNPTCQLLACYSEGGKTMEKTGSDATALYDYLESISFGGVTIDEEGYVHPAEDTSETERTDGTGSGEET